MQLRDLLCLLLDWGKRFFLAFLRLAGLIFERTQALVTSLHIRERLSQSRLAAFLKSEQTQTKFQNALRTVFQWTAKIILLLLGLLLLCGRKAAALFMASPIGQRLSGTKLAAFLRDDPNGILVRKGLCLLLCLALVIGLFSVFGPKEQPSSSSSSYSSDDCWRCGGSGNCDVCGGDGRVVEWMGDQYMDVRCTSCIGGNCRWCDGSGEE